MKKSFVCLLLAAFIILTGCKKDAGSRLTPLEREIRASILANNNAVKAIEKAADEMGIARDKFIEQVVKFAAATQSLNSLSQDFQAWLNERQRLLKLANLPPSPIQNGRDNLYTLQARINTESYFSIISGIYEGDVLELPVALARNPNIKWKILLEGEAFQMMARTVIENLYQGGFIYIEGNGILECRRKGEELRYKRQLPVEFAGYDPIDEMPRVAIDDPRFIKTVEKSRIAVPNTPSVRSIDPSRNQPLPSWYADM